MADKNNEKPEIRKFLYLVIKNKQYIISIFYFLIIVVALLKILPISYIFQRSIGKIPDPVDDFIKEYGRDFVGNYVDEINNFTEGNKTIIFENIVILFQPSTEEVSIFPAVQEIYEKTNYFYLPIDSPMLTFYEIQDGLGHNIPSMMHNYIMHHGGYAISGPPLTEFEYNDALLVYQQCFYNICLIYNTDNSEVNPLPIANFFLGKSDPYLVFPFDDTNPISDNTTQQFIEEILVRETRDFIEVNFPHSVFIYQTQRLDIEINEGIITEIQSLFNQYNLSKSIGVQLTGSNFDITPLNNAKKILPEDGISFWSWDVTPNRTGELNLNLSLTFYFLEEPDGWDHPVIPISVNVFSDRAEEIKKIFKENFTFIITTILGLPTIIFGVVKFISWIKTKKETENQEKAEEKKHRGLIP